MMEIYTMLSAISFYWVEICRAYTVCVVCRQKVDKAKWNVVSSDEMMLLEIEQLHAIRNKSECLNSSGTVYIMLSSSLNQRTNFLFPFLSFTHTKRVTKERI